MPGSIGQNIFSAVYLKGLTRTDGQYIVTIIDSSVWLHEKRGVIILMYAEATRCRIVDYVRAGVRYETQG